MTVKAVVFAIIFVFTITLMIYMLEFFPPLSVKYEMNTYCRNALLSMEIQGGMSSTINDELENGLEAIGLKNIIISSNSGVKLGDEISIKVEADYVYMHFKELFLRESVTQKMVYSKTSISRKVIN